MGIYLDTSAINQFYDDSARVDLMSVLSGRKLVPFLISEMNLYEIGCTRDPARRAGLLGFAGELGGYMYPLAQPVEHLRRASKLVGLPLEIASKGYSLSVDKDQFPLAVLRHPELVDDWRHSRSLDFAREHREWLRRIVEVGRPALQEAIANTPEPERTPLLRSPGALIRAWAFNEEVLSGFVRFVVDQVMAQPGEYEGQELKILGLEVWRCFLAGLGYTIYNRAVRQQGFGERSHAGAVDSLQAAYLSCCSVMVTHDKAQRRMLRFAARFASHGVVVVSYEEFRARLLGMHP